jgi:hypothetical protein
MTDDKPFTPLERAFFTLWAVFLTIGAMLAVSDHYQRASERQEVRR